MNPIEQLKGVWLQRQPGRAKHLYVRVYYRWTSGPTRVALCGRDYWEINKDASIPAQRKDKCKDCQSIFNDEQKRLRYGI